MKQSEFTPCPVGRTYSADHTTCRTCQVNCLSKFCQTDQPLKPFKLSPQVVRESQEQANLAKFLNFKGLLWCHVPNEGKRTLANGGILQGHGMKKGVPDVLIFCPPPAYPDKVGTAIELKRRAGGKVSEEQQQWLDNLTERNWLTTVSLGWEEAVKFLKEAGY